VVHAIADEQEEACSTGSTTASCTCICQSCNDLKSRYLELQQKFDAANAMIAQQQLELYFLKQENFDLQSQ
jgi:hypothetical protein